VCDRRCLLPAHAVEPGSRRAMQRPLRFPNTFSASCCMADTRRGAAFVLRMESGWPSPDGHAGDVTCRTPNVPGQVRYWARGIRCCTPDRYCTTTIRATAVGLSRSSGLRNAISFANADHAKSLFDTIAFTAMGNNGGRDIPSRHRRPYSGRESPAGTTPECRSRSHRHKVRSVDLRSPNPMGSECSHRRYHETTRVGGYPPALVLEATRSPPPVLAIIRSAAGGFSHTV
jgi:hypothetical protein